VQVSLLVAILDRNYTLLSECRGGQTSLVVFVRSELADGARVLGKAATDRVVAINGAACLVISLGGIEVSIVAVCYCHRVSALSLLSSTTVTSQRAVV